MTSDAQLAHIKARVAAGWIDLTYAEALIKRIEQERQKAQRMAEALKIAHFAWPDADKMCDAIDAALSGEKE
jgi:hypothetical protein